MLSIPNPAEATRAPSGGNSSKPRWYTSPGMRDEHGPLPHLPPALSGAIPQLLAPHRAPLPLPQLRRQRLLLLAQQPLQPLPPPLQPRRRLLRVPPLRRRAAAHTGGQRDPGTAPGPAAPRPYLRGGTRGSLHRACREQQAAARAKARLVLSHCCRLRASSSRRSAALRSAPRPHHIHSDIAATAPAEGHGETGSASEEGGGERREAGREEGERGGTGDGEAAGIGSVRPGGTARRWRVLPQPGAGPLCRVGARSTAGFVAL